MDDMSHLAVFCFLPSLAIGMPTPLIAGAAFVVGVPGADGLHGGAMPEFLDGVMFKVRFRLGLPDMITAAEGAVEGDDEGMVEFRAEGSWRLGRRAAFSKFASNRVLNIEPDTVKSFQIGSR